MHDTGLINGKLLGTITFCDFLLNKYIFSLNSQEKEQNHVKKNVFLDHFPLIPPVLRKNQLCLDENNQFDSRKVCISKKPLAILLLLIFFPSLCMQNGVYVGTGPEDR